MATKKTYSDRIILGLQNSYPEIDFKIDEREVFLVVDDIVNAMAKQNYLDNWKIYGAMADESFVTEWSGANSITVVDPADLPSYIVLPAVPVALPMNGGILEVWPDNYSFGSVKIMRHEDVRRTRNLMSGNLQEQLGGFPSNIIAQEPRFVFNQINVGKNFAPTFGVRLCIKNSSAVGLNDPFPLAPDIQQQVIDQGIQYFMRKRMAPTDTVRDSQDALTRN